MNTLKHGRRFGRFLGPFVALFALVPAASATNWTRIEQLSPSGRVASAPGIAIHQFGTTVAVWNDNVNGGRRVVGRIRTSVNKVWEPEQVIAATSGSYTNPQVVISEISGTAVAAWVDGTDVRVAMRYDGATGWSAAETIGQASTGQMALAGEYGDGFVVAWVESTPSGDRVVARTRSMSPGWAFGPVEEVAPAEVSADAITQLALRTSHVPRRKFAVWARGLEVWASSTGDGTSDWTAHKVATGAAAIAHPDIALNSGGRMAAAWVEFNGQTGRVHGALHPSTDPTAPWSGPSPLDPARTSGDTRPKVIRQPSLPGTPDFLVAWVNHEALSPTESRARLLTVSDEAGGWSLPQVAYDRLGTMELVAQDPRVVGGTALVFVTNGIFNGNVNHISRDSSGKWSQPTLLAEFDRVNGDLSVGTNGFGDVAVAWSKPLIGSRVVQTALFDTQMPSRTLELPEGSGPTVPVNWVVHFALEGTDRLTQVHFDWSFGDGTSTTIKSYDKAWSTPGVYEVVGTITDESGNALRRVWTVTVTPAESGSPAPPGATVTPAPTSPKPLVWSVLQVTPPPAPKEAVISGRKVVVRAKVRLRAGMRCGGRATATMGSGSARRVGTLTVGYGIQAGVRVCLAYGSVTPAAAPRVGATVAIQGTPIMSRLAVVKANA